MHCFNDCILPLRDVDIHATRVNGLSVRTVRGVGTLFKDNQPLETVSLAKSLENFLIYLEKTVRRVKSDDNIHTVIIGHNSQVLDNPTLFRQSGHRLCRKLSCLNVFFSDTLPVMKNLVKVNIPLWSYRMVPQLNYINNPFIRHFSMNLSPHTMQWRISKLYKK